MKHFHGKISLLLLINFICFHSLATDTLIQKKNVLSIMEKVADWQLDEWKNHGFKRPGWDWTNGAGYTGLIALSNISKKNIYQQALLTIGDSLGWETGPHRLFADDYCIAQTYCLLYKKLHNKDFIKNFTR